MQRSGRSTIALAVAAVQIVVLAAATDLLGANVSSYATAKESIRAGEGEPSIEANGNNDDRLIDDVFDGTLEWGPGLDLVPDQLAVADADTNVPDDLPVPEPSPSDQSAPLTTSTSAVPSETSTTADTTPHSTPPASDPTAADADAAAVAETESAADAAVATETPTESGADDGDGTGADPAPAGDRAPDQPATSVEPLTEAAPVAAASAASGVETTTTTTATPTTATSTTATPTTTTTTTSATPTTTTTPPTTTATSTTSTPTSPTTTTTSTSTTTTTTTSTTTTTTSPTTTTTSTTTTTTSPTTTTTTRPTTTRPSTTRPTSTRPTTTRPTTTVPTTRPSGGNFESIRNNDPKFDRYRTVRSNHLPIDQLTEPADRHDNGSVGDGQFRAACAYSHFANDDPIVYPGQPGASHLHMFFGNTETNAHSTTNSLVNSGGGSCNGFELNRSAYWTPALLDGRGNVVVPDKIILYYKSKEPGKVQRMPQGLKMISGNTTAESFQVSNFLYWSCGDSGFSYNKSNRIPDCNGDVINASISFPQCWDGVNFDSHDHRSHLKMVDPELSCPASHPVTLPQISILLYFPGQDSVDGWHLSSDRSGGFNTGPGATLHADWWGGWNDEAMDLWVDGCMKRARNCSFGQTGTSRQLGRLNNWQAYLGPNFLPLPD
jgi:hypothetical protein